jgi:hypothetical protein
MNKITFQDWQDMSPLEREAYFYTVIGVQKKELARMIAEFEFDRNAKPNAVFISYKLLAKIPMRIKKVLELTIIPIDGDEQQFALADVDPWDQRWEHLFFT